MRESRGYVGLGVGCLKTFWRMAEVRTELSIICSLSCSISKTVAEWVQGLLTRDDKIFKHMLKFFFLFSLRYITYSNCMTDNNRDYFKRKPFSVGFMSSVIRLSQVERISVKKKKSEKILQTYTVPCKACDLKAHSKIPSAKFHFQRVSNAVWHQRWKLIWMLKFPPHSLSFALQMA